MNFLVLKCTKEKNNLLEEDGNCKRKGKLMEKRVIKWLEVIPKPTKIETVEGAIIKIIEETKVNETNENDKNEKEGDKLEEDPNKHSKIEPSHRIFTIIEDDISDKFSFNVVEKQEKIKREKQINQKPIRLEKIKGKKHSFLKFKKEKMKIMAYLGQLAGQNYNLIDEYLLFELTLLNNRLLKIEPDFEQKNIINTRNGNFAAKIFVEENIKEFDELKEEEREEEVEEKEEEYFETPESAEEYWLHYFIEIARARDFPNSNLRVEWLIQLPLNAELRPTEMIEGISHFCESKTDGNEDIFHFGQLLQFSINWKTKNKLIKINNILWPNILFRLTSQDCWNRLFLNGFSNIQLPTNPGINYFTIKCWKPFDSFDSKFEELHSSHLGEINCFGASENWPQLFHPKINSTLKIKQTGFLDLIINCSHQSNHFISRSVLSSMRYSKMVHKASLGNGLHWRITKVLEEFERAKRQLIAFRERKDKQRNKQKTEKKRFKLNLI
uniref:Uncharacterized protein n=1 Tax=Meloidogyne enterolobii TaxID=390850 RepID=A0A6V7TI42_MELEN|nr:unnamed protein product [Meloidogyne enterolobii]